MYYIELHREIETKQNGKDNGLKDYMYPRELPKRRSLKGKKKHIYVSF